MRKLLKYKTARKPDTEQHNKGQPNINTTLAHANTNRSTFGRKYTCYEGSKLITVCFLQKTKGLITLTYLDCTHQQLYTNIYLIIDSGCYHKCVFEVPCSSLDNSHLTHMHGSLSF